MIGKVCKRVYPSNSDTKRDALPPVKVPTPMMDFFDFYRLEKNVDESKQGDEIEETIAIPTAFSPDGKLAVVHYLSIDQSENIVNDVTQLYQVGANNTLQPVMGLFGNQQRLFVLSQRFLLVEFGKNSFLQFSPTNNFLDQLELEENSNVVFRAVLKEDMIIIIHENEGQLTTEVLVLSSEGIILQFRHSMTLPAHFDTSSIEVLNCPQRNQFCILSPTTLTGYVFGYSSGLLSTVNVKSELLFNKCYSEPLQNFGSLLKSSFDENTVYLVHPTYSLLLSARASSTISHRYSTRDVHYSQPTNDDDTNNEGSLSKKRTQNPTINKESSQLKKLRRHSYAM